MTAATMMSGQPVPVPTRPRRGHHGDVRDGVVAGADPHGLPVRIAVAVEIQHQRAGNVGGQSQSSDDAHDFSLRHGLINRVPCSLTGHPQARPRPETAP